MSINPVSQTEPQVPTEQEIAEQKRQKIEQLNGQVAYFKEKLEEYYSTALEEWGDNSFLTDNIRNTIDTQKEDLEKAIEDLKKFIYNFSENIDTEESERKAEELAETVGNTLNVLKQILDNVPKFIAVSQYASEQWGAVENKDLLNKESLGNFQENLKSILSSFESKTLNGNASISESDESEAKGAIDQVINQIKEAIAAVISEKIQETLDQTNKVAEAFNSANYGNIANISMKVMQASTQFHELKIENASEEKLEKQADFNPEVKRLRKGDILQRSEDSIRRERIQEEQQIKDKRL